MKKKNDKQENKTPKSPDKHENKTPKAPEKPKKEPKRKAKYGTLACIRWLMTRMWQWEKWIVLAPFLIILPAVALHACGLYLPSIILESLETSEHFGQVAQVTVALIAAQLFFTLLRQMMDIYRRTAGRKCSSRFYYELTKKTCDLDYYHWYDVEYMTLKDRAGDVLSRSGDGSPGDILVDLSHVIINAACFLIFSSIISMLSPWIIALLVLASLINLWLKNWKQDRDWQGRDERNANGRKINYLSWWLSNTSKAGKDIRLYNMTPFLDEKGHDLVDEYIRLTRKTQNTGTVVKVVNLALAALRDGLAYLFVILGTVEGSVSAAEAVLYFTAISQMSGFIDGILGYFNKLHQSHLMVSDCIEYLDESRDRLNRGPGIPLPQGRPLSIEFRDVSYKYPEGEKNVIDHVSFKIEAGEKISLVGLNGAGKTTLTHLMCGIVLPDEGEVLIDGHSIMEYNRDEMYTLFGMVAQNYATLPTTIAENIALRDRAEIDEARLWQCMEEAGIAARVRDLPHGIETQLGKKFEADGVELSGGEMQKLLLARALYRAAPILILDEPTAALDPIAEDRMYRKYNDIAQNCTSVFISHRLASTRFCDRIYLLDGAKFAECGTHEELMARGGKYRELFDVQSKYYREEVDAE